ncbi:MAG TPA: hypothetical protein VIZ63_25155 [Povalibacter sp.]
MTTATTIRRKFPHGTDAASHDTAFAAPNILRFGTGSQGFHDASFIERLRGLFAGFLIVQTPQSYLGRLQLAQPGRRKLSARSIDIESQHGITDRYGEDFRC